jgi:TolA-binding protein
MEMGSDDPASDEVFQELMNDSRSNISSLLTNTVSDGKSALQKRIKSVKGKINNLRGQLRELEMRYNRLSTENSCQPFNRLKKSKKYITRRSCPLRLDFSSLKSRREDVSGSTKTDRNFGAISMPCVSVLFTDILGFTSISSKMPAHKVCDLLERLFSKFDALATKHKVRNIDIIGDAYMAATNLLDDQPHDHAARIARFALDAIAAPTPQTPLPSRYASAYTADQCPRASSASAAPT